MRTQIVMSTDGACKGNPGPGGWGAILKCGEHRKELAGYQPNATNNQMELRAVIEGIRALKKPCHVVVETDSHYVCTGIANGPQWALKGWKLRNGKEPANVKMWKELAALTKAGNHTLYYNYVKGHSGNPDNERCDQLAKEQILKGA